MREPLAVEGGSGPLRGQVRVPGDKSISHRALLLAALAEGPSQILGLSSGDDVLATRAAVEAMGARIDGPLLHGVGRIGLHEPGRVIDVGNSGTGIRLLAGYCAALPWLTVLEGDSSIAGRPMDRVVGPLRQMGATVDGRGDGRFPPLVVRGGGLRGIDLDLAVPSAQVKGAVLLAGLGAEGATVVRERVRTRAHSEEMLADFGADISVSADGLTTTLRPSTLRPCNVNVPGDPSQAAFWLVAGCIVPGSEITVIDVYVGPARAAFLDVLNEMGADISQVRTGNTATITARYSPDLRGVTIEGDVVPGLIDEVPVLAVAAAVAEGETVIRDAAELRLKESDRVATTVALLAALGADSEPRPDGLVIAGRARLRPGSVESAGDHRIAMAGAVGALVASGTSFVKGWDAVRTSYPGFETDLATLQAGGTR